MPIGSNANATPAWTHQANVAWHVPPGSSWCNALGGISYPPPWLLAGKFPINPGFDGRKSTNSTINQEYVPGHV